MSFVFNPFTGTLDVKGTGSTGASGTKWFNGDGVPDDAMGHNGDFYLDNETGNYYTRTAGSWTLEGSLKGEPGDILMNVDGGDATSNFGGIDPIDGGGA